MNRYEKWSNVGIYQSKLTYTASSIVECASSEVVAGSILKHARGTSRLGSIAVGLVAGFTSAAAPVFEPLSADCVIYTDLSRFALLLLRLLDSSKKGRKVH